ncbi:NAD binding domain of 6-phosphogluconate dehydrogenase-domain-containing protein [Coniella lustricola]|uniref:NAD binding domain of 6-phosphogluconate dehydrogenase-domain-containing protein n=1 Tax=Coniella lustricola TaxID=2025994 RepID=A0A2T2ZZA0_9PEZI|nr:NAD binding domain of 6-phosphogluconate dehydrogenase-domain-containing protein [Coniella lustricola]
MASKPPVAFIGLGAMGFGMATHLLTQGYAVTAFDVFPPTLDRFLQHAQSHARGSTASTASSPSAAVAAASLVVCMVATAAQAHAVLFSGPSPAAAALPRGATLLLCSTVPCAYVRDTLATALVHAGRSDVDLVDAPVSGGSIRAADGTLSIMAAGSDPALAKARPLLQAMAAPDKLYIVPGGVGAGSNMKMCHQVLAANHILAASEALGLAKHLGLDLHKTAAELLVLAPENKPRMSASWMLENRLPRILAQDKDGKAPVASAVTIILKDAGIITSEARRCGFPTPLTSVAEQVYLAALGRGWGAEDDASLVRLYSEGVGRVGPVSGQVDGDEAKTGLVASLLEGIHLCSTAETVAFAHHVGLDLDQVYELCVHAAGGSQVFASVARDMIRVLQRGASREPDGRQETLPLAVDKMQTVVDEAQRLKCPLFLGSQALNLLRLALIKSEEADGEAKAAPSTAVLKAWAA